MENEQAPTPEAIPPPVVAKPATMNQLVENELALIQKLYENEGEFTPEIEAMMALGEGLPAKVDGYAGMLARLATEIEHIERRMCAYKRLAIGIEKASDWMRDRLRDSMIALDRKELLGIDSKFVLMRASPRLEIDEAKVPALYMVEEIKHTPDKKRIKELMLSGTQVPGARLIESQYVRQYLNNPAKVGSKKLKPTNS